MLAVHDLGDDGALVYHNAALKATAVQITAGDAAAVLYGFTGDNLDAAAAFLQFYDALAADVTVGTTPAKLTVKIPTSSIRDVLFRKPVKFTTAITVACTTTATGNTDPTNGDNVNVFYFE